MTNEWARAQPPEFDIAGPTPPRAPGDLAHSRGELLGRFLGFRGRGVSDALDGFIAKRFDRRTRLGALLDPLADKVLLVSVYVTLGIAGQLWAWLVVLVVFRDIMIIGGFLLIQAIAAAAEDRFSRCSSARSTPGSRWPLSDMCWRDAGSAPTRPDGRVFGIAVARRRSFQG